jgi:hypothetical protein
MGRKSPPTPRDTTVEHRYPESPKSPSSQVIPRRFPRIGSQFQTRIPKSTDPLERPAPDVMSMDVPYTTVEIAAIYEKDNNHWINGTWVSTGLVYEGSCRRTSSLHNGAFMRVSRACPRRRKSLPKAMHTVTILSCIVVMKSRSCRSSFRLVVAPATNFKLYRC